MKGHHADAADVIDAGTKDEGDSAQSAIASSAGPSASEPSGPPAANAAASPPTTVKADSKLRRGAVGFEWKDVMLTLPTSITARDAVYELGSVIEALALWKMARAAQLCADARQGTPGEAVSQVLILWDHSCHLHQATSCISASE